MKNIIFKQLGRQPYSETWQAMQDFTNQRTTDTADEIWLLEHPPVFTQGYAGKPEHLLNPGDIPVIQTDRGGQITYHGPGQLVAYLLVDIRRRDFNIRQFVTLIEESIINLLADYQITAGAKPKAPGVYVEDAKICSLGLRVRRGCTYHGLALNVALDLTPFKRINPCGFQNLAVTQISELGGPSDLGTVSEALIAQLESRL